MANMAYLNAFVTQPPPKTSAVVLAKLKEEKQKIKDTSKNSQTSTKTKKSKENTSERKTESTAAETHTESVITPEKADPLIDMIKQI